MFNLAQPSTPSPAKCSCGRSRRCAPFLVSNRGLTLVEVLVSAFVLVVALSTFLGTVVQAYRIDENARRRDQVRAVLQSFVDEFNRGSITYVDPADNVKKIYAFFDPLKSPTPTGFALQWTDSTGNTQRGVVGDANLKIRLGDEATAPEVTITRQVSQMDETTGVPGGGSTPLESTELFGEFVATWTVEQHQQRLAIQVVRCANATSVPDPTP